MDTDETKLNQLTEAIIGCAYKVSNRLGCGFLEKVYENALALELRKLGYDVKQQFPISVMYDGVAIGDYFADLLVEDLIVIDLKASKGIDPAHVAQCINYLTATGKPICLLIHFGNRVEVKRIVRPGLQLDQ